MQVIKNEVIIFKSPSEHSVNAHETDQDEPYSLLLRQANFSVKSIPVLDFCFTNLKELQVSLLNPAKYSGIIFTSPRAVTAAKQSLDVHTLPSEWNSLRSFVVGEGTSKALLNELGLRGEGSIAGNAGNLADFILEKKYNFPLLFPCGNLKRDSLPTKLRNGGVELEIMIVYQSQPHPRLVENLQTATANGTHISEYLVYFSPSGVKFTLPVLREFGISFKDIKIVAIGPTTKSCLEEAQLSVWSAAEKPNPGCLLKALSSDNLNCSSMSCDVRLA